jgi:hypothetical protein
MEIGRKHSVPAAVQSAQFHVANVATGIFGMSGGAGVAG